MQVAAEIARLESIFSLYQQHSALSTLNRLGVLITPPPELVTLLEKSRTVWDLTGGLFDPTVQPLWQAYAQYFSIAASDPAGPSRQKIESALDLIGFDRVIFNHDRIAFAQRGMALTLNGIAQGYITDRIVDLLRENGITSTIVNMGEVRAVGMRSDGTPWRVGINDLDTGPVEGYPLVDRAIATSSPNGFRFGGPGSPSHLLHPRSGASESLYGSVSIVAPEAATADALSTAFGFLTVERISGLLTTLPDTEVHLVRHDGRHLHLA